MIVRADATESMGIGHIMRCLSLARIWQNRIGPVVFISHCSSTSMEKKIKSLGIQYVEVASGISASEDQKIIASVVSRIHAGWLILDGYHFIPEYHACIETIGCRLLVIDDYHHLPFYQADILVNPNINAADIDYKCTQKTKLLLGRQYAILSKEFSDSPRKKHCSGRVKNILITMGGADPENISGFVLNAFNHIEMFGLNIRVIIGPGFDSLEALRQLSGCIKFETELIENPEKMSKQMLWADIAISAAGSTCWELAYIGLPSLLIVAADNQQLNADAFSKKKVFYNLGSYHGLTKKMLKDHIEKLLLDKGLRERMFRIQQKFVDGKGADRLIEEMIRFEGKKE